MLRNVDTALTMNWPQKMMMFRPTLTFYCHSRSSGMLQRSFRGKPSYQIHKPKLTYDLMIVLILALGSKEKFISAWNPIQQDFISKIRVRQCHPLGSMTWNSVIYVQNTRSWPNVCQGPEVNKLERNKNEMKGEGVPQMDPDSLLSSVLHLSRRCKQLSRSCSSSL